MKPQIKITKRKTQKQRKFKKQTQKRKKLKKRMKGSGFLDSSQGEQKTRTSQKWSQEWKDTIGLLESEKAKERVMNDIKKIPPKEWRKTIMNAFPDYSQKIIDYENAIIPKNRYDEFSEIPPEEWKETIMKAFPDNYKNIILDYENAIIPKNRYDEFSEEYFTNRNYIFQDPLIQNLIAKYSPPLYPDSFWKRTSDMDGIENGFWKSDHPAHTQDTLRHAIVAYLEDDTRTEIIEEWGMIENWNVSQVTDMKGMFKNAENFNQDIGEWNVSNVTDMSNLFSFATNFNQDIGGWNVSKVNKMTKMFIGAKNFNQDIGEWNVSQVTNMNSMFNEAENFDQNIGGWNVSNIIDMSRLFDLAKNFNQDIGVWNVSNVSDMKWMFADAENFNQDIVGWNVSKVTNMSHMFDNNPLSDNPPDWYR